MALKINQETFNNVVRENIEDLGMTPEEAVKGAIEQFELQGADLSLIIKDLMIDPPDNNVQELLNKLESLNKAKDAKREDVIEQLDLIKAECEKGLPYKVEAGRHGAYDILLDTMKAHSRDNNVLTSCLRALIALMSKQPDLFDEKGIDVIHTYLKKEVEYDVKRLTLKWTRECCVMHEMNRQLIFNSKIVDNLKELLGEGASDILREVLSVSRALVLDDDVRVEFGKAHEHARVIASETLCALTGLLTRFKHDETLMTDLMLTLCSLMVRAEFCKKVDDAGGLNLLRDVLKAYPNSEKIARHSFKLIKALAGNDECKAHMIEKGLAPIIINVMVSNKDKVQAATAGLSAIAALSLRAPKNSTALFEAGAPAAIIEIMKLHPEEKSIQKSGSWAIRNMVSRCRDQSSTFLELGAEEILHAGLKKYKDIEYDLKAALRDLGCKVQLKEEWTGKGGALTTGKKP
ncbi:unnamed protein product [Acanthoscelides obtectus]|nr:unnamed protein product [Acanthoscelides obtectus]CAK1656595.1 Armadillo repeat-containing protein 6 homolog [Acanthoscelides obtectus]